jgi:hypothetical protein
LSSVSRKRVRSDIDTTHQTGSDIQMSSMKTETNLPIGNLLLYSDSKPSTDIVLPSWELPPPAVQQRQQYSTALVPYFAASSLIVNMPSI